MPTQSSSKERSRQMIPINSSDPDGSSRTSTRKHTKVGSPSRLTILSYKYLRIYPSGLSNPSPSFAKSIRSLINNNAPSPAKQMASSLSMHFVKVMERFTPRTVRGEWLAGTCVWTCGGRGVCCTCVGVNGLVGACSDSYRAGFLGCASLCGCTLVGYLEL